MPRPTPALALLAAMLAPLIWGSTYWVTTEFLPPDRPLTAAVLRCLPAGALLLLFTRQWPARGEWGRMAWLGFLNIGFFQAMLFVAAYRLPGGVAAILMSTQVLMVLCLSAWWGRTPVRPLAWWSAALGVLGVGLLVLSPQAAAFDAWGVAAALGGAASLALGTFLSKRWQSAMPVLAFTGWQLLLGGLCLLPAALWLESWPDHLSARNVGGYLYLCLAGAVLAYTLFFWGLRQLPPAVVASLGLLSPLCAFVLGWALLGQGMTGRSLLGFALVLLSVWGVQRAMLNGQARG